MLLRECGSQFNGIRISYQRDPVLLVAEGDVDTHRGLVILVVVLVLSLCTGPTMRLLLDICLDDSCRCGVTQVVIVGVVQHLLVDIHIDDGLSDGRALLLIFGKLAAVLVSLSAAHHPHLGESGHVLACPLVSHDLRVKRVLIGLFSPFDRVMLPVKLHAPVFLGLPVQLVPHHRFLLGVRSSALVALLRSWSVNLGLKCQLGVKILFLISHLGELFPP